MPINFPDNPSVNDTYSESSKTWIWDGSVWNTQYTSVALGPTGPTGPAGADGANGLNGTNGTNGTNGSFDTAQTITNVTSLITIENADAGTLKTNTGAGGNISVVIALGGGPITPLGIGKQVDFLQTGSYQFVFSAEPGVTLYSKDNKLKTNAQYSPASIKCISANTYVLVGDLGA
jgi:hypothetical protein